MIPAYRNPFIAAEAISTLDALAAGRVILGEAGGYLEAEFAALGAPRPPATHPSGRSCARRSAPTSAGAPGRR